jgi:hypothetical protein
MSSAIVGSSVLAAACRIQEEVVVRDTPKSLANKPHEAFPREDERIQKAVLTSVACEGYSSRSRNDTHIIYIYSAAYLTHIHFLQ